MSEVEEEVLDDFSDETKAERQARIDTEVILDEMSQAFVDRVVDKLMIACDDVSGHPLYDYQQPFARRIFESLIVGDGETITALFSRQSGKSETVANVVATAMIFLPVLAKIDLGTGLLDRFKEGVWVGAFAPVEEQADNLYGRIVARLSSEHAAEIMADPEINDRIVGKGRVISLKRSGSLVRKQTCHPRAIIEGRTYHLILVDECQGADSKVIRKSVEPMGASTNATTVLTGTPTYTKNVFYEQIQFNKREHANGKSKRCNHFEADWKAAAKSNTDYGKYVKKKMLTVGEDSDEFRLSYRLHWLLDKGMFTTSSRLDELGDISMQSVVHAHHLSPVVVGIDPARKQDSTIVTVVWVDWANPDPFGYYDHRVLNWLDLGGMDWEEQYFQIVNFLSNYNVLCVGIDVGGLGDVVANRLKVLMPYTEIVELGSQQPDQSRRWKHLMELMNRGMISWPSGAKVRKLKSYRKFRQQMEDLEKQFKGPYVLAMAPEEAGAHDDYPDSLAMACILTEEYTMPEVEVTHSPFYRR